MGYTESADFVKTYRKKYWLPIFHQCKLDDFFTGLSKKRPTSVEIRHSQSTSSHLANTYLYPRTYTQYGEYMGTGTRNVLGNNNIAKLSNKAFDRRGKCKWCGSEDIIKRGKVNGKQQYGCKACGKRFLDNNKFPNQKTEKEVMAFALDSYYEGLSLRKVSRQIKKIWGLNICASAIFYWIQKYAPKVKEFTENFKTNTKTGRWHHDESYVKVNGEYQFFWDMIDERTKYLLSGFLSGRKRGVRQVRRMYKEAKNHSNGMPFDVYCDNLRIYERAFNKMFPRSKVGFHNKTGIKSKVNNNPIERFHSTLKDRLKVMRGLQNPKALLDGFILHYNFIRPPQSLGGRTPAEASNIKLPFTDGWGNLIDWAIKSQNDQHFIYKLRDGTT